MLNPFSNHRVIREGLSTRGWVRHMPSGPPGRRPASLAMTIDVLRPDGSGYAVKDRWLVPGREAIAVGSELCLIVDREKQDLVAIDWVATRELHEAKSEELRRILPVGVPVPATKVREEAEIRGLVSPPPQVPEEQTPAEEAVGSAAATGETPEEEPDKPVEVDELVANLERLAALHASGELTDEEYIVVKRHLIT